MFGKEPCEDERNTWLLLLRWLYVRADRRRMSVLSNRKHTVSWGSSHNLATREGLS